MSCSRLRVYYGPETEPSSEVHGRQPITVRRPLAEVLPLLTAAASSRRTWLEDFDEDEITLSADLYEVLLAYRHCLRPGA